MTQQKIGRGGATFGEVQRKACSRAELARWDPKLRRQDALETLGRAMRGRVPALVTLVTLKTLKDERMRASPFGVSRGAVPVMASDQRETPMHSLERLTKTGKKGRVFRTEMPVLRRLTGDRARAVLASLKLYSRSMLPERRKFLEQFRPVDVAFKVVGTGSVGLRDYCVYLEGNGLNDPLFLQVKQEVATAYAGYVAQGGAWSDRAHKPHPPYFGPTAHPTPETSRR